MRIGITCYPSQCGSGAIATELGRHLAAKGHEVAFISYTAPLRLNEIPPRVSFHEVGNIDCSLIKEFPYTLALASKMVEIARNKNLQILHVHYAIPFAPAAIIAKQIAPELDLKIITTLHGSDVTLIGNKPLFKAVTTWAIEQSDEVTVVSDYLNKKVQSEFQINKCLNIIKNFIDPQKYKNSIETDIPQAKKNTGQFTLMHISNFKPSKRITDVVKIFALVSEKLNARLLMAGDGPDVGVAMRMARNFGIDKKITFFGVVGDLTPLLQVADLLLLPSENESFGLAALEAMACAVPVIASDAGGLPEVIKHGETGYLAPVGDVEAMADYAIKLLSKTSTYKKISVAAKKRATELFPHSDIIRKYEELYKSTLIDGDKSSTEQTFREDKNIAFSLK